MPTDTPTTQFNMVEIARRIQQHLLRLEKDTTYNQPTSDARGVYCSLYFPRCYASGPKVAIVYISYQGVTHISKADAWTYLCWLRGGGKGTHRTALRDIEAKQKRAAKRRAKQTAQPQLPKTEKQKSLAWVAAAITVRLRTLEADKTYNDPRTPLLLSAKCYVDDGAIYIEYAPPRRHRVRLTKQDAVFYLDWLREGNKGRHWDAKLERLAEQHGIADVRCTGKQKAPTPVRPVRTTKPPDFVNFPTETMRQQLRDAMGSEQ